MDFFELEFFKIYMNGLQSLFYYRLFNVREQLESDSAVKTAKKNLLTLLVFLKLDWLNRYKSCIDIVASDRPGKVFRFSIIYYLLSVHFNTRMKIIIQTNELEGVNTTSQIYKSNNWPEREVWDLYGIFFVKHTDLRRILTDYAFTGHPLRRDYPLTGYKEVGYNQIRSNLHYYKIELTQELRHYKYYRLK